MKNWKNKMLIMAANSEEATDWIMICEVSTYWPELAQSYRDAGWGR